MKIFIRQHLLGIAAFYFHEKAMKSVYETGIGEKHKWAKSGDQIDIVLLTEIQGLNANRPLAD